MPRLLSLFNGTGSLLSPFSETWDIQSLDICGKHGSTIVCDIMTWDYLDVSVQTPDVIWAGCPCTEYSVAKTRARRDLAQADALVRRTWQIISHFLLENPAMLYWVEKARFKFALEKRRRQGFYKHGATRLLSIRCTLPQKDEISD